MTPQELTEARKMLGLTITDMAKRLNTPRGTYIKWERGERRLPGIVKVALKTVQEETNKNM